MEVNIKAAREFAESCILTSDINPKKEHYYLFLISRFLLLKEYIIKKDSKNSIINFDYQKSKKHLPVIKQIVDYVRKNGTVTTKKTEVNIENFDNSEQEEKLKEYIWIFNKIRDSFAHGKYKIDVESEQIIIDNDHSHETEPYCLKCTLPLKMLEYFTYYAENADKDLTNYEFFYKFDQYKNINREIFNYKHYYNYYPKEIDIKKEFATNNYEIFNNMNDLVKLKGILNSEEKLRKLIKIIMKSEYISEKNKIELINYLKKAYNIIVSETKIEIHTPKDKFYEQKLAQVIAEMSTIIGIDMDVYNMLTVTSLYNYMQLTLSFRELDYKNMTQEEKKKYANMRLSRLNPEYIKNCEGKEKGIIPNENSQYFVRTKLIQKKCDEFTKYLEKTVKQYKENKSISFEGNIMQNFTKFYNEITELLAERNVMVITSIRNSITHANIDQEEDNIVLKDFGNQFDEETINFKCTASPEDLLEFTETIESKETEKEFTISNFFEVLKEIITQKNYEDLTEQLTKMKEAIFGEVPLDLNQSLEKLYIQLAVNIMGIKLNETTTQTVTILDRITENKKR